MLGNQTIISKLQIFSIHSLLHHLGILAISLHLISCAHESSSSNQGYSEMIDQDWLFKLSVLRIRDETILKTQDRVPLNFSDLEELIKKELATNDIEYLVESLGISPALTSREIDQIKSFGASPTLLKNLGVATQTSTPKTVSHQTNTSSSSEAKDALKTTPLKEEPIMRKTKERKTPTSHPSSIPPQYTQPVPPSFDPMSRR